MTDLASPAVDHERARAPTPRLGARSLQQDRYDIFPNTKTWSHRLKFHPIPSAACHWRGFLHGPVDDHQPSGLADPIGPDRAVKIEAVSRVDRALALDRSNLKRILAKSKV